MKHHYREIVIGIFIIAVIGNITIFISSMRLSSEIHSYEQNTFVLKQENIQLEREMADIDSFLHTKKFQLKWGFERNIKPIYISDLPIAFNTIR